MSENFTDLAGHPISKTDITMLLLGFNLAKCQPTCRIFCNNLRNEFY
ncbi:hypothetical protein [methane-oxidizing endosymbiont of Gigantopelta aegis]|nr:hypothetical protein [methane-oxidizing endosymbiont of Gigantopelta aegis]